MRIHSIKARNYGPFSELQEMRLGPLATIVGQNDVGKSNILRALRLFFEERPKIESSDVHDNAAPEGDIVIEVSFTSLPQNIELEKGVATTLQDEMLVDDNGHLRIRKTYPRDSLTKFKITLITRDFEDDRFAGLATIKEDKLNKLCESLDIDVSKSGRGIKNLDKRKALRAKAEEEGIQLCVRESALVQKDDLWKKIASYLPAFELFETDTKLGVGETTFQSQFRPIISASAENPDVVEAKNVFTGAIGKALQEEVDKIFERLQQHTDAFESMSARPQFSWDKAVSFEIAGKDQHGVEQSLERRGSGMRRLLMVAFFQYLAGRKLDNENDCVFAIEEPENCLHPKLQRELITSFRQLADEGHQIIITSHSPVFAGASPIEDLALVVRTKGATQAKQYPELDLSLVAEELGVEPADQITGYSACVFVEGPCDIKFFKTVASKLKEAGHIDADFDDKGIGFVITGGASIKYWIDCRAMNRLSRRFGIVVDSDKKDASHKVPDRKLHWKEKCEKDGGVFFILQKREIENYLHPDAIKHSGQSQDSYDDFTDMKKKFGDNIYKAVTLMSAEKILERDCYKKDDGTECHELKDIIQALLSLPDIHSN